MRGIFKDGKINGKGVYDYANGDKYIGDFKEGKREGIGECKFTNGESYTGEWKNNQINGKVTTILER